MSSTNVAIVDGYLGRDSELRFSPSGFAFLSFSVAVKSQRKVGEKWEEQTSWIDCKTIGKRAEGLAKILVKGTFCVVAGRLEQEKWTDKDGGNRSKIVLFADNISLGPKPASGGGGRRDDQSDGAPGPGYGGGGATDDDDIPFAPVGDIG